MGTSSEDVLLMVNNVRHKKNDGTLYMMGERIAWMLEGKDSFSISHKYADVKMQKISPDGKSKVQLQVVLHNGDNTTFHFVNPMGSEVQLQERNDIKELLQQLLPKFKKKVNKELEEKNKILAEDPVLFQLYRDLVVSDVITSEEFWANYTKQGVKRVSNNLQQDVGVSAAFLADINPQTDGSNGLKYNITAEIIDSIFRTYPAVKKRHMENVPHKITESEFWTRFFQSHYFHRDRLNMSSKDIFSECAKNDEQDIEMAISDGIRDPFVDVSSFKDFLDDDHNDETTTDKNNQSKINQSMIRRFNHHSMMVLKSCSNKKSDLLESQSSFKLLGGIINKPNGVVPVKSTIAKSESQSADSARAIKKARLQEKIEYEDLVEDNHHDTTSLNLGQIERYLHGPTPVSDSEYISTEEHLASSNQLNTVIKSWRPNLPGVLAPSAATIALGELLPGGSLMKNTDGTSVKDTVPVEIQNELKQLYLALAELLRHFWSCFPATTSQLQTKVFQMKDSLHKFQYAKLAPFQEKLSRHHMPIQLTEHLMGLLDTAYKKFSTWQSRAKGVAR